MTETCKEKVGDGNCKRQPFFHELCKQHLKMHILTLEASEEFRERNRRREDEINSVVIKALSEYGASEHEIAGRVNRISRQRARQLIRKIQQV